MAEVEGPGKVRKAAKKAPAKKAAAKKSVGRPRKAGPRTASGRRSTADEVALVRPPQAEPEIYDPSKDTARKAYLVRRDGGDWVTAMKAGKYNSVPVCQAAVSKYIRSLSEQRGKDTRQEDLDVSIAFYENIIYTWRVKARSDTDAANIVLKARAQLDKILRLGETESTAGTRTIVVAGNESSYIAGLMQAAREQRESSVDVGTLERAQEVPEVATGVS